LTTDFGEYDNNGVWRPIEYTGSYGTNGYYLKFDPSATNGIGHDHSGNGNNWTANNFDTTNSTASTYDVMSDTPTTNWCTLNPVFNTAAGSITSNGNLNASFSSDSVTGTIGPASGKWYFEVTVDSISTNAYIGIADQTLSVDTSSFSYSQVYVYLASAVKGGNGSTSSYGATYGAGDVIGVAYDLDAGSITFYKNGTSQGVAFNSGFGSGYNYRPFSFAQGGGQTFNFGQRAFAYTPPTGFKALNTSNLSAPTVKDGSDYFNTVLYTGTGVDNHAITGVGFQPSWAWIKTRSVSDNHSLHDEVRGANRQLFTNSTDPEFTATTLLKSFDSDGFTLGTDSSVNGSGRTLVAWNWLASNTSGSSNTDGSITSTVSANPAAGFSIVTYTGNNTSGATVGHGLGVAPSMIICKRRENDAAGTSGWQMYHTAIGATKVLYLDKTDVVSTDSAPWNNTEPTSTVFTLGNSPPGNPNGDDVVAYCFAEVEGYSKFGVYKGTNNIDNTFIYLGFKPAFFLLKNIDQATHWNMHDSARHPYNDNSSPLLRPGTPNPEDNFPLDFLSNGIKLRTAGTEAGHDNRNYIFAAFAEHPFGGSGVSPATAR
jgi:hypothetical protein